jgi:sulfopyruvate decarboxylase subunit alpha
MTVESTIHSKILNSVKAAGSDFFLSVPCKLLAGMIAELEDDSSVDYLPVTREEEGMGLCAGAALAGRLPTILMQDTGIGNSVNALVSLIKLYQFPLVMLISYRGTPGEPVAAQAAMAMVTDDLFKLMRIPVLHCHNAADLEDIQGFAEYAHTIESPVAITLDFNVMGGK